MSCVFVDSAVVKRAAILSWDWVLNVLDWIARMRALNRNTTLSFSILNQTFTLLYLWSHVLIRHTTKVFNYRKQ